MSIPKMDAFGTHLPLLAACVAATSGPVLELGCGLYSTPVLHALCLDRPLMSLESNAEWLAQFKRFASPNHRIAHVPDWEHAPIDEGKWAVALIDQEPAAARAPSIARLRGRVDLFVIHDSEHRLYAYEPLLSTFKHRVEWQRYAPWTTVVTDDNNLDWLKSLL